MTNWGEHLKGAVIWQDLTLLNISDCFVFLRTKISLFISDKDEQCYKWRGYYKTFFHMNWCYGDMVSCQFFPLFPALLKNVKEKCFRSLNGRTKHFGDTWHGLHFYWYPIRWYFFKKKSNLNDSIAGNFFCKYIKMSKIGDMIRSFWLHHYLRVLKYSCLLFCLFVTKTKIIITLTTLVSILQNIFFHSWHSVKTRVLVSG